MFCPCCAGRTGSSIHHLDESGNSDGDGRCLASDQFETHRVSEPCMPRIPGDLLGVPIPVITDLVNAPIVSYFNVLIIHPATRIDPPQAPELDILHSGTTTRHMGLPEPQPDMSDVRRTSARRKRSQTVASLFRGGGSGWRSGSRVSD